jgi:hypothetical protein
MTNPPARSSLIPVGALLPSAFKTLLGEFYDYATDLLGTDGTAASAREGLNIALPNYLDNPDGAIYQRAVAATADDVYMDDRWYALTQTATITPSQVSNPEDGYRHALRLTQSQAVAQRMGRAQIIDGRRTSELRGKTVTFGGRLKLSTTAVVRMAILACTGAEDVVTSDVVNNWASATYTTGNFFASTSLTLVATGTASLTAATAANASVSGAIPSGATNLIVLYWTEATAAQNVTLDAWGMRVVDAATLVDYIERDPEQDLADCQRFYETGAFFQNAVTGVTPHATVNMRVAKRATPTMAIAPTTNITASASTTALYAPGGGAVTTERYFLLYNSAGAGTALGCVWAASADL